MEDPGDRVAVDLSVSQVEVTPVVGDTVNTRRSAEVRIMLCPLIIWIVKLLVLKSIWSRDPTEPPMSMRIPATEIFTSPAFRFVSAKACRNSRKLSSRNIPAEQYFLFCVIIEL